MIRCRPLYGLCKLLVPVTSGCAALHPRAGSPAEHLGWGARLYANTRFAGYNAAVHRKIRIIFMFRRLLFAALILIPLTPSLAEACSCASAYTMCNQKWKSGEVIFL